MTKNTAIWVVIAVVALILVGMFVQDRYDLFVAGDSCPYVSPYSNTCEKFIQSIDAWKSGLCSMTFLQAETTYIKTFPEEFSRVIGNNNVYSCSGGTNCNTAADTNCNGVVDRNELGTYIADWISNQVTRENLGLAIQAWMVG